MTAPDVFTGFARYVDGIPFVRTTAERDARYPTPPTDFRVQNGETNAIEQWNGSAWVPVAGTGTRAFDVREFGAIGNGVVDDTAPIQAALDQAALVGGLVSVPPGIYRTTATLVLDARTTIVGVPGASLIRPAANVTPGLLITTPTDPNTGFGVTTTVQGLSLDLVNNQLPGMIALQLGTAAVLSSNIRIIDCELLFGDPALRLADVVHCQFVRCIFAAVGAGVVALPFAAVAVPTDITFDACLFVGCGFTGGAAADIRRGRYLRFRDCLFEHNRAGAVSVVPAAGIEAERLFFSRCWFENNRNGASALLYGIVVDGSAAASRTELILDDCVHATPERAVLATDADRVLLRNWQYGPPSAGGRPEMLQVAGTTLLEIASWDTRRNGQVAEYLLLAGGATGPQVIGDYRQAIDGWNQDDVAAGQTDVELVRAVDRYRATRAGSLTGVSVTSTEARTAGTLTVTVFKNTALAGAAGATTGLSAVLNAGATSRSRTTQEVLLDTYLPGDELYVVVTTDAGWLPVTADIRCTIEVAEGQIV